MDKLADHQHPILDVIAKRWSPRSFADRPVEPHKIKRMFEAARWAASSYNEQPWRYILATSGDSVGYAKALDCLVDANQAWAKKAPVIILTVIRMTFSKDDSPNRVALHDLGLSVSQLTIQAMDMGLYVHQMAGVNLDKMRETYNIPEGFEPQTAIAVGYPGEPAQLPDGWMREAEHAPRARKPLTEIVVSSDLETPSPIVQ